MRVPRLYSVEPIHGLGTHELGADSAHYLAKVLRLSPGRPIVIFDGNGGEYRAEIATLSKKSVTLNVIEFCSVTRESPLGIELAIGISRGDRFDWVLQKATEMGVTQITPLFCERVEVKLAGERLDKKHKQWQQITLSACEQSQRTLPPILNAPQTLKAWLTNNPASHRFVLHHRSEQSLAEIFPVPQSVSILIGPEGGLSDAEIEQALVAGHRPMRLGPRVLRTETAPIAALSVMQYLWGDMG